MTKWIISVIMYYLKIGYGDKNKDFLAKVKKDYFHFLECEMGLYPILFGSGLSAEPSKLHCPFCQADKQGEKVIDNGETQDSMCYYNSGNLYVYITEYQDYLFVKFECENCDTDNNNTHKKIQEFYKNKGYILSWKTEEETI